MELLGVDAASCELLLPRVLLLTPTQQSALLQEHADLLEPRSAVSCPQLRQLAMQMAQLLAQHYGGPWSPAVQAHARMLLDSAQGTAPTTPTQPPQPW